MAFPSAGTLRDYTSVTGANNMSLHAARQWAQHAVIAVSVAWVVLVAVSYFAEITIAPSAALCRGEVVCLGSAAAFSPRDSHTYYWDAWQSLFGYEVSVAEDGDIRETSSPIVPVFLWSAVLCGACVLAANKLFKKGHGDLRVSPAIVLGLFSLVFFLVASAWESFYGFTEQTSGGGIVGAYIGIVLALLFVGLVTMAWGASLRKWFFPRFVLEGVGDALLSFGLGAIGLVALLFLLLSVKVYSATMVWAFMLLLLAVSWRGAFMTLHMFTRPSIPLRTRLFGVELWLGFALFIVAAHNALELIRPIPIGFDDLGLYMIIPKVLSERGALISGLDPYAWGIFMSLGFTLFRSAPVTLFLSSVMGVLCSMALYAIVQCYAQMRGFTSTRKYALFAAAFFLTLPTIIFQSSKDMKFDLASLFFQLLAVLVFLQWYGGATSDKQQAASEEKNPRSRSLAGGPKDPNPIYHIPNTIYGIPLIGLFLGMAFVTKYTALFMVMVLGSVVSFVLIREIRRGSVPWKVFGVWIIALVIPLLPIIPGILYNYAHTHSLGLATFRIGPYQGPNLPMDPPLATTSDSTGSAVATGVHEELGRYIGYGGWRDYLQLPFTVTLNPLTSGIYVDVGFLFLAFVPLLVFIPALRGRPLTVDSRPPFTQASTDGQGLEVRRVMLSMGVAYWILWATLAKGVIWYGYGGFVFILLAVVEILALGNMFRWGRYVVHAAVGLWLASTVVIRSAYLPEAQLSINRIGMEYARGSVSMNPETGEHEVFTGETFMRQWIPTYVTIRDTVNTAIKEDPETNVYRVGTFTKYFIYDSFAHVLDDNQLDVFAQASSDNDDAKTIQRFKNGKFKYMIIDTNTATIDHTPEQSLTKKYNALIDFVYRNSEKLKILVNDTGVMLVEIQN